MNAGKTLTAPLDRVKLLLQTRGGLQGGALKAAARGGGVWDALVVIGREEGFLGYWKGNIPQVHPEWVSLDHMTSRWALLRYDMNTERFIAQCCPSVAQRLPWLDQASGMLLFLQELWKQLVLQLA